MADKLITVQRAKMEINRLQQYIDLVENYEASTIEKWIIKEYGYTNSFIEIERRANVKGITLNGEPIDKDIIRSVIDRKPKDESHRLLRSGYKLKIRANKR